ncbi:MAG: FAD-binding oxidoreductase [Candidatus Helarchaeota archaeon]|nr:FAD-binding oxidoreductase [Candidatus Helarchaeota archaeon]
MTEKYGKLNESIINKLIGVVGESWVTTDPEDLYIYARDMTEAKPGNPEAIVLPKTTEDVRGVLEIANDEKIPVVPYIAAANIGGLTIPLHGGIMLDLKRMNKVIKVDEVSKYAVVEPGVTFGHIKAYLAKNNPDFIYSYAFSPPYTSIVANALLEGLTEFSVRWGAMGDWIVGLEVVLPTGEIVKIGSCATSDHWNMKYPLPDLTSLFIGWQGMTGVVTKCSVKLVPKPTFRNTITISYRSLPAADKTLRTLVNKDIIHGESTFSTPTIKMMTGMKHPLPPMKENEALLTSIIVLFSDSRKEDKAKQKQVIELTKQVEEEYGKKIDVVPMGRGDVVKLPQTLPAFMEFRSNIGEYKGAGMSWLGTYCPPNTWMEAYEKGWKIMEKYGFAPLVFNKMMDAGHFMVVRYLVPFNKAAPGETEKVRAMLEEILEQATLPSGAIPYKCPAWAAKKVMEKIDPNWINVARRVRKALDPNEIMNPGRWNL